MMRRAKFHCGPLSQWHHPKFKTFKLSHCSHALSPVSHSVSEYHLKLPSVLVVCSPPNHMVLLAPLPTVHQYSQLQYHTELLQHQLLLPHPTVGPIVLWNTGWWGFSTGSPETVFTTPHVCSSQKSCFRCCSVQFSCPCSLWPALFLYPCPSSTASSQQWLPTSPPWSVGLCWTWTFSQLPSTLPNAHSMFARDDGGGADPTGDNLVDEVSSSDDDHLAESVVCGESKSIRHWCVVLTIWLGEVKDVVAQYHHCNCGPCLPNNAWLMAICNQQTSEASHCVSWSKVDDLDNLETPIDPPTSQPSPSTTDVVLSTHSHPLPPASPTTAGIIPDGNSDPSQLLYTPPVHNIIERANKSPIVTLCLSTHFHCMWTSTTRLLNIWMKPLLNVTPKVYQFQMVGANDHLWELRPDVYIYKGWWPQYMPGITKLVHIVH